MPRLQLVYDLRRAPFCPVDHTTLYATMLDQCAWADRLGFDAVMLGEHHGSADGYLPSPVTLTAAVAGRTRHLGLRPMVVAPFVDPLRLAEELAVVDLASAGRLTPLVLAGYAPNEFEMFGVDRRDRPALVEEAVEVLKQAWTGEPFTFRGRTVRVTPRPHQRPRPTIVVGGMSAGGARRAARIGDEFQAGEPGHWRTYVAACEALGRPPGPRWIAGPAFLYVTDDPERAWAQVAPYISHHSAAYGELSRSDDGQDSTIFPTATDVEALKAVGAYQVLTPDEAVTFAERFDPDGALIFTPLMGGLPPDLSWPSLELFETAVLPRLSVPARPAA